MQHSKAPLNRSVWQPEDYGFKAWAYDPSSAANSTTPTLGTLYVVRLKLRKEITISNVILICSGAGSALTGSYVALYQNGAKLVQSADQGSAFQSAGAKTVPVTPVVVPAGDLDIAVWFTGTTAPDLARAGNLSGVSQLLTGSNARYATADTGITTTAPATLGAKTTATGTVWTAVS